MCVIGVCARLCMSCVMCVCWPARVFFFARVCVHVCVSYGAAWALLCVHTGTYVCLLLVVSVHFLCACVWGAGPRPRLHPQVKAALEALIEVDVVQVRRTGPDVQRGCVRVWGLGYWLLHTWLRVYACVWARECACASVLVRGVRGVRECTCVWCP